MTEEYPYRLKLMAILEGAQMPEIEKIELLGGLAIEFSQDHLRTIGRLRGQVSSGRRVLDSIKELKAALSSAAIDYHEEPEK